ncbi:MAG: hypothetical protein ACOYI3_06355 [Christensenellales bacterium]|jgi:hypothetical protein
MKLLKKRGRCGRKNPAVGIAVTLLGLLLIMISGPASLLFALIGGILCCGGAVLIIVF